MTVIGITAAVILFLIVFVFAPAFVCYLSVFGRRKVLTLDDEKLFKPAIEPYKERMLDDLRYLRGKGFECVTVTAKDGVTLAGDLYDRGEQKTAIMVHGYNADPYVNLVSPARWLYDHGFNVLVIYHRAHSRSGGNRCGMGLIEKDDIPVWIDFILHMDASQRILLYGASMGGTTLAYLSDTLSEARVPCMMIDCGYICTDHQLRSDAKRMHLPPLIVPLIRRIALHDICIDICEPTTEHLRHAKKPILFFHGTNDLTVPLEEGKANFDACTSEKELVIVENAGHTTAFLTDEKKVCAAMQAFINRYF